MLETQIKSVQQFQMFAKVLGICLLFVLTSCPLKASIKQHINMTSQTAQKNMKLQRTDFSLDYLQETCSAAMEQLSGAKTINASFQFQPALISLGIIFLFALFLPKRQIEPHFRENEKHFSKLTLIQINRLNI